MKILKTILIIIVLLIVIILVVALFVPKEMNAEREIVINKPKQQVFDYIKFLKNQDNYSRWNTIDPNMKKEYRGTDGTAGFVYLWDSENPNAGKGEQEITKIAEGERVDFELRFIKPFKSVAQAYMTTEAVNDNQTKVRWGFKGKMNYPLNIIKLFMNPEKAVGDDFAFGLTRLKEKLEK